MKLKESVPARETQKESVDFVVLNEALKGKTEAELTPEERKAEAEFGKQNLETFLEGIDEEKLMVHAFTARAPFSQIYKEGILSRMQQRHKKGEDLGVSDPLYQERSAGATKGRVGKFLGFYKDFEDGKISREKFLQQKQLLLWDVPEVGRQRYEYFFEKTIPEIVRRVGYPRLDIWEVNKESSAASGQNSPLNSKEPFRTKLDNARSYESREGLVKDEPWYLLVDIMSGCDMVSSTSAEYMKKEFADKEGFLASFQHWGLGIYFETPPDIRLYDLRGENDGSDVGVSSIIEHSHFKALRMGFYDTTKRVLLLGEEEPSVQKEDIPLLVELQKNGVTLLDQCLVPIPPLESISIDENSLKFSDDVMYPGGMSNVYLEHVKHQNHPRHNQRNFEMLDEKPKFKQHRESVENSYLFKLMLNNQLKSLDMIQAIGKEKGYTWTQ
jgi:hypothetical protein